MQKAIFDQKQENVVVKDIEGVKQYTICLNEEEIEMTSYEPDKDTTTIKIEYQYDFNQFYDSELNEEDVKTNPGKYLDYVASSKVPAEESTKTLDERISTVEQRQDDADQALQDLICTVMGE